MFPSQMHQKLPKISTVSLYFHFLLKKKNPINLNENEQIKILATSLCISITTTATKRYFIVQKHEIIFRFSSSSASFLVYSLLSFVISIFFSIMYYICISPLILIVVIIIIIIIIIDVICNCCLKSFPFFKKKEFKIFFSNFCWK